MQSCFKAERTIGNCGNSYLNIGSNSGWATDNIFKISTGGEKE